MQTFLCNKKKEIKKTVQKEIQFMVSCSFYCILSIIIKPSNLGWATAVYIKQSLSLFFLNKPWYKKKKSSGVCIKNPNKVTIQVKVNFIKTQPHCLYCYLLYKINRLYPL